MLRKCTATKLLLWLALMCLAPARAGEVAGTVTRLSGPLMAKKADGKVKILALRSEVETGDTLITERDTYALVKFIDNSEITLKPGTTFIVERFVYQADQPGADRASFSLLKGGLRSLSGLLGKRSREKFELKTPAATIGIRGTYFIATYGPPPGADAPPGSAAPGLAVTVTDGMIVVSNAAGQQEFKAGQSGFTASPMTAPVLLPPSATIEFAPPPAFSTGGPGIVGDMGGASVSGNGAGPDCTVR